jgi:hypothetical protein
MHLRDAVERPPALSKIRQNLRFAFGAAKGVKEEQWKPWSSKSKGCTATAA